MRALLYLPLIAACAGTHAADVEASSVRESLHAYALAHEVLSECQAGTVDDHLFASHEDEVRRLLLASELDCQTAARVAELVAGGS